MTPEKRACRMMFEALERYGEEAILAAFQADPKFPAALRALRAAATLPANFRATRHGATVTEVGPRGTEVAVRLDEGGEAWFPLDLDRYGAVWPPRVGDRVTITVEALLSHGHAPAIT